MVHSLRGLCVCVAPPTGQAQDGGLVPTRDELVGGVLDARQAGLGDDALRDRL